MRRIALAMCLAGLSHTASATELATVVAPPLVPEADGQIVLKNDSFADGGGQAYLQLGFVAGEMAGIWTRVPNGIAYFKIDSFRVLFGSSSVPETVTQAFFQLGVADQPSQTIPEFLTNAVELTPGPYWNDIPAQGDAGQTLCARGGQVVGAALEFTHAGAPSVYRDLDGISEIKHNTIMAVPGGWAYSVQYGLRGDWVMRIVGHEATAADCGLE